MATTGGRENFVQKVSKRKSKVEVILAIKKKNSKPYGEG